MRALGRFLSAGFVLAAFAAPARAQAGGGVHFGVAGGESLPVSDSKDDFKNGWHAGAMLTFGIPLAPVAVRVEGMYLRMDRKESGGASGDRQLAAGVANAVVSPASLILVKPYFIGGAGLYSVRTSVETIFGTGSDTETKIGWNAGGGVAFSLRGTKLFVEARYHRVSTSGRAFSFVPVSVGVLF